MRRAQAPGHQAHQRHQQRREQTAHLKRDRGSSPEEPPRRAEDQLLDRPREGAAPLSRCRRPHARWSRVSAPDGDSCALTGCEGDRTGCCLMRARCERAASVRSALDPRAAKRPEGRPELVRARSPMLRKRNWAATRSPAALSRAINGRRRRSGSRRTRRLTGVWLLLCALVVAGLTVGPLTTNPAAAVPPGAAAVTSRVSGVAPRHAPRLGGGVASVLARRAGRASVAVE